MADELPNIEDRVTRELKHGWWIVCKDGKKIGSFGELEDDYAAHHAQELCHRLILDLKEKGAKI